MLHVKSLLLTQLLIIHRDIDYYGITFDHLVPKDEYSPEVLMLNISDMDEDGGEYANGSLLKPVDPADYIGKKVLAVPRCCQKRRGKTDQTRVNGMVAETDLMREGHDVEAMRRLLTAYGVYSTRKVEPKRDKVPWPLSKPLP